MDTIDIHQMAKELSREELEAGYCDLVGKVGALTTAINYQHPLIMGKGDDAIATACRLILECKCR